MSKHNIKLNCKRNTNYRVYIFLEEEKREQTFSTAVIDHVYAHTHSHTQPYTCKSNTENGRGGNEKEEKGKRWEFSTPK